MHPCWLSKACGVKTLPLPCPCPITEFSRTSVEGTGRLTAASCGSTALVIDWRMKGQPVRHLRLRCRPIKEWRPLYGGKRAWDYGDVWLRDMDRGLEDPFTFDGTIRNESNVVWSPDGSRIAFSSTASESVELYISDVPASGPSELIFGNGNLKVLTDWSRDGYLLYTEIDPETGSDLWYLPLAGHSTSDVQPVAFLRNEWDESFGQIAPNGQWIAYVSNETGSYEVYVQPFLSGVGKWRISTAESGTGTTQQPRWSRDGGELFYVTGAGEC